jgi:hypothetical protein
VAKAIIEGDEIVIRIPLSALPRAVENAGDACGANLKLTDAAAFAPEFVRELNREEENGDTPIYKLLDRAIMDAWENGAEGIEEVEDYE